MSHWFALGLNMVIVVIVLISFLFTCKFALKRLEQHSLVRRIGVVTLNFMAGFSLLALVLGVSYQTDNPLHVVLLTHNADKQAIVNLQQDDDRLYWVLLNAQKDDPIDILSTALGLNTHNIENIAQLPLYYPKISDLTIMGDGLSSEEWSLLNAQYAHMKENHRPVLKVKGYSPMLGLIDMQWPEQLVVGQSGQISGRIQAPNGSPNTLYRLSLKDPFNQELESVLLSNNEDFSFAINFNVSGQWQYTLALTERGKQIINIEEQVAIQIINPTPVKMMIKQSAPSFESKLLQMFVGESDGKILTLTKISKNKDIRQEINLSAADKILVDNAFSEQALNFFDLLIIDQLALSELSKEQSMALETAIKRGLGVLVKAQTQQISNWPNDKINWLRDIKLTPDINQTQQAQYLRWDKQQLDIPLSSINASIQAPNAKQVVSAQNNRALVVTQEYGQGKVAISLVNTSYTLKTQGKAGLHSHYWQWLFSQISRTNNQLKWQKKTIKLPLIASDTQQACVLNAVKTTQFNFKQAGVTGFIDATEQLLDANSFCVRYAPQAWGWYNLTASDSQTEATSIAYFAYAQSKWQAWQQSIRYRATQQNKERYALSESPRLTRTLAIEPSLFWAMLLAALTILWIERKQSA